jgi:DNA-binding PadR family transcriptional regulator
MHGYELARTARLEGLGRVCPIEQSALYAYLRNVELRGLVLWREQRAGRRPPRKLYSLTPDGVALVDTWLRSPVARMREIRREFLVKVHLLASIDPDQVAPLVERQLGVCRLYLEGTSAEVSASTGLARLVALSRSSAAVATRDWLEAYLQELRDGRGYAESVPGNRRGAADTAARPGRVR